MDNIQRLAQQAMMAPPHIRARYRAVLWEPIPGTGERVVALLSVEPERTSEDELLAGTYPVLKADRLRAIFGRKRGDAAAGVVQECAQYMTQRQQSGVALEELKPLFGGFMLGPVYQARAYSMDQLLDAAVRTVSALGTSEEILAEGEPARPGQTRGTAEFLREVRRVFAGGDEMLQKRFHVKLQREQSGPEVWIDYASGHRIIQAASVPGSTKQAHSAEFELKAKLLDLQVLRDEFKENSFEPALLLNVRSLESPLSDEALRVAKTSHEQFRCFAEWARLDVIEVSTPSAAALVLEKF